MKIPPNPDTPFGKTPEERSSISQGARYLAGLGGEVRACRSALTLYLLARQESDRVLAPVRDGSAKWPDVVNQVKEFDDWAMIAARAVMDSLFQGREHLDTFLAWASTELVESPLRSAVGAQKACDLFDRHFPKYEQLRHAAFHRAEIGHNPELNRVKAPISRGPLNKNRDTEVMLQDFFEGDQFMTMRKGEMLKLEIVPATYEKFLAVYELLLAETGSDGRRHR